MTAAQDISTILPEERRKQWEAFYAKQDPIIWAEGENCSRCGAYIYPYMRQTHELWHKNLACQLWLMGGWPVEHLESHARETNAFQAVIASILGFIDPPSGPSAYSEAGSAGDDDLLPEDPGAHCGTYEEEVEADELKADGKVVARYPHGRYNA